MAQLILQVKIQFPLEPKPPEERDPKPKIMKLGKLWLYGNVILLDSKRQSSDIAPTATVSNNINLDSAVREAEEVVLAG